MVFSNDSKIRNECFLFKITRRYFAIFVIRDAILIGSDYNIGNQQIMKEYFPYFAKYKMDLWLTPLLVIIDVVCEVVQPQLMSRIVDFGVPGKDISYIVRTGIFMVFLAIIAIAANVGNVYYSSRTSVGFSTELRKSLFHKIQQFSFSNIDKFSSASLTTRMTKDVNILQMVIMMSMRLLIRSPLMFLFALFFAVRINTGLAAIIALAVFVLAILIAVILHHVFPFFEKMQRKLDKLNKVIQENLGNVRVVKSFVREDYEKKKFGISSDELRDISAKASGIVILILPVMQLVMNLSIVAIVWFGGKEIVSGTFKVGQLMSFITYCTQILMSLMMLAMTMMVFSRAKASIERISEVMDTDVDIVDSPAAKEKNLKIVKGKVEFRNVFFKYQAESEAYVLHDISLTVNPGETVAIIGATGSSKSTLVQLIPRLYEVTSGCILVDDADIRDYTLQNLRAGVGMVLQNNELFSGTIRQNLKWGNTSATDEEICSAAKDAQAHDFIMSFPLQYETVLGQGGVNISGGQKQRLCIARAIMKKPVILILDDSTSAVDIATEQKINDALRKKVHATTFLITQRINSVLSADKIIVLDNGGIIGSGTHDELIRTNTVYQEIYQSQQLKLSPL